MTRLIKNKFKKSEKEDFFLSGFKFVIQFLKSADTVTSQKEKNDRERKVAS